jgi:transglutaminase-like putative cysteine protease
MRWIPFVVLLSVITGVTYYQLTLHQTDKVAAYPIQRTVKYSFTIKNPNNYPIEKTELLVYTPIKEGVFQQLESLSSSHSFQLMEDGRGNKQMAFAIENLPPYASKTVSVTTSLNLSDEGNQLGLTPKEAYLNDGKYIGLKYPAIQRLARKLKADSQQATVKRIYKWMVRNIKKSGYDKNDLGAPDALEKRSGDCTEFMYLFSALARANGIPTRNMAGFVAKENRILRPADYHNWNEVYIDGTWYLVDADKQVLMQKSSEYIAMRLIADSVRDQFMDSQGFFSANADIRVSMN